MALAAITAPPAAPVRSRPQAQAQTAKLPAPLPLGTWRIVRREQKIAGLSWAVAIAAGFLIIGIIGIFQKEVPLLISLGGRAGFGASDAQSTEMTMAELHAMEDAPEVVNQEEVPPEVVELADPVAIQEDLPDLAEPLELKDVFTVPAAPKVVDALTPVDPAKPKPKAQPKPAVARSSRSSTIASGTQGGSQGSGGGNGGTLSTGSGSGGGKFPQPNYPSSARSRGVSGPMTLALSVNPSGAVESASVISSQGGFTSGEQDSVASFVRRYWHFPTGAYRKHTVKVIFKLTSR